MALSGWAAAWADDAPPPLDLAVTGVRIGVNGQATRFVLDLNQSTPFQIITVKDSYRMILTMPALRWELLPGLGQYGRGLVRNFRYGSYENNSFRIVLDLKAPIQVTDVKIYAPDPNEGVKYYRLAIDMVPIDVAKFRAQRIGAYQPASPLAAQEPIKPEPVLPKQTESRVIVIDAGHGGVDPGAIGRKKSYEKNITLQSALELKEILESTGKYKIVLTRDSDEFIPLRGRLKRARAARADLFISLHADHHPRREVSGASVYTLSEKASDAEAGQLAEQENKADIIAGMDLSEEDEKISSILIDLAQQETRNHSIYFGNLIVEELKSSANLVDSPLRSAGFAVLKAPDIPSVLIEMGFLSNARDEELLKSKSHRIRILNAVADAINAYFHKIEISPHGAM